MPWFCFAFGDIWHCLVLGRNQVLFCGPAVIPVVICMEIRNISLGGERAGRCHQNPS